MLDTRPNKNTRRQDFANAIDARLGVTATWDHGCVVTLANCYDMAADLGSFDACLAEIEDVAQKVADLVGCQVHYVELDYDFKAEIIVD